MCIRDSSEIDRQEAIAIVEEAAATQSEEKGARRNNQRNNKERNNRNNKRQAVSYTHLEAESVTIKLLRGGTSRRILFFDKDFADIAFKGRTAKGNIVTRAPIERISIKEMCIRDRSKLVSLLPSHPSTVKAVFFDTSKLVS